MSTTNLNPADRSPRSRLLALSSAIVFCCGLGVALARAFPAQQSGAVSQATAQRSFATPEAAADALIQAAAAFDVPALQAILGPGGEDLVASQDPVHDKQVAQAFAAKAKENHSLMKNVSYTNRATLVVGSDMWPLPIPIVKTNGKWLFDTKAAHDEMLFRRIGENELDAIQVCRGYVDAQQDYASQLHDGDLLNQYAQRILSTPGKHDGLLWRNANGSLGGPISEPIAKALAEGYSNGSQPYHGYYFKILTGQGPAAPLGQMDFVIKGAMIGGFAMAAAPAQYRVTGVKTFLVGYDGVVYQKDLGPKTLEVFKNMDRYNPDKTWVRTDDNWP